MRILISFILSAGLAACGLRASPHPGSQPLTTNQLPALTLEEVSMDNLETDTPPSADLPDLGPAPELENEVWLNTEQPLRLSDLRGKVVLLDMWTFG